MFRFRLRTLLIVLAIGLGYGVMGWFLGGVVAVGAFDYRPTPVQSFQLSTMGAIAGFVGGLNFNIVIVRLTSQSKSSP